MTDKTDRFEITKHFMAQADRDRRFYGTINRDCDADGTPVIPDRIKVITASQWLMAGHQDVLGSRLDEMIPCSQRIA